MDRTLVEPQPELRLDGRRIAAETRMTAVGASVVVLATSMCDRGLDLHSTYVGHDGVEETHVTHLLLAPEGDAIETRTARRAMLPVAYARRRCLYDHLVRLQDFAADAGLGALEADVADEVLRAIEA